MKHATPIEWKILVTDDVQSQNIRCHVLRTGDQLQDLITRYRQNFTMALIVVNTTDGHIIEEPFLEGMEGAEEIPVVVLTWSDGGRLMNILRHTEDDDVLAKIEAESAVDVVPAVAESPPVEAKKEPGQQTLLHM